MGLTRPYNMQIWPGRRLVAPGYVLQNCKVANVDWTQCDEVDILSYRSGKWEEELLQLLSSGANLHFMPRR
jgi:hypothetical protein